MIRRGPFGVSLPEAALGVTTLRQLLAALPETSGCAPSFDDTAAPASWSAPAEASPDTATTLVEVLDWHAATHPERVQIVYLSEAGELPITYRQLQQQADLVAAGLQRAAEIEAEVLKVGQHLQAAVAKMKAGKKS